MGRDKLIGGVAGLILLGGLIAVFSQGIAAQSVSNPVGAVQGGTSACCAPHAGGGCGIAQCEACVCEDLGEGACCGAEGEWTAVCVGLAASDDCALACQCSTPTPLPSPTPGGDCCTTHAGRECDDSACTACVCGVDSACCASAGWDATCVDIARTVDDCAAECPCEAFPTPPPDPTPTPGDCCEAREANPSCDEAQCSACVCGMDNVCCTDAWDADCVSIASIECGLSCSCAELGDCCVDHGGPGCDVRECQECVIDLDPLCAESWDADCVAEARIDCAIECPCGDCCVADELPGCGEKTCQSCVCAQDPACCDDVWDGTCESIAKSECALECPCGDCCADQVDVPGCGEKTCQNCVCDLDANCCDDVWDGFCADRAAGDCADECGGCASNCCQARVGEAGCDIPECEDCICGDENETFCCDEFWDEACAELAMNSNLCAGLCQCGSVGGACVGDCNGDGSVSVGELITGIGISLGERPLTDCASFDSNGDGSVSIAELIQAVNRALDGC